MDARNAEYSDIFQSWSHDELTLRCRYTAKSRDFQQHIKACCQLLQGGHHHRKNRHQWRNVETVQGGTIRATCNHETVRLCLRCHLIQCAAPQCSDCTDHQPCTPIPGRKGRPEKAADFDYPRRAATKRLVAETFNSLEDTRPCHNCSGSISQSDSYCRHCGCSAPYAQKSLLDAM